MFSVQEQTQEPRGETDERGLDLRLTTFNLLAPCYKRMHTVEAPLAAGIADAGTGLLARRAKTERTARESEFAGLWRERAMETVREMGGEGRGRGGLPFENCSLLVAGKLYY